ncbi:MAG: ParA family protein [Bradyrhizobium sp.]|nr:ParA family protein [Bradyrhizobium sp.]
MSKILTSASMKGGVGKTSNCVLMAQQWRHQFTVAIIDTNPLAQAYNWATALNIPATHAPNASPRALRNAVDASQFDILIFDTPPANSTVIGATIALSDVVMVPYLPADWEMLGLRVVQDVIEHTRKLIGRAPLLIGIPSRSGIREIESSARLPEIAVTHEIAPAIHRWVEIQRAASHFADLYSAFPTSTAQREIASCSQFVLNHLRTKRIEK